MYCAICGTPVFEAYGYWFHDVEPRYVATPARSVTDHKGNVISLPEL
jgi:hypothetical protein